MLWNNKHFLGGGVITTLWGTLRETQHQHTSIGIDSLCCLFFGSRSASLGLIFYSSGLCFLLVQFHLDPAFSPLTFNTVTPLWAWTHHLCPPECASLCLTVKTPTLSRCKERAETRQKTVCRFKTCCLTRPWEELSPGTPPSKHKQTDFCQSVNVNLYYMFLYYRILSTMSILYLVQTNWNFFSVILLGFPHRPQCKHVFVTSIAKGFYPMTIRSLAAVQ